MLMQFDMVEGRQAGQIRFVSNGGPIHCLEGPSVKVFLRLSLTVRKVR